MRTDVDARTEVKSNCTLYGSTQIGRSVFTCQENSIIPSEGELVSPKNLYLLIASKCISQVEKKELPGAPGGIFSIYFCMNLVSGFLQNALHTIYFHQNMCYTCGNVRNSTQNRSSLVRKTVCNLDIIVRRTKIHAKP